jgi:hypothetical protein
MDKQTKQWARDHGFSYVRGQGWRRDDGCFISWNTSWGYRVHTRGGGFHPTEQPS